MKTYGNNLNYPEWEKQVADKLKQYIFLEWQNKKTLKLAKKLFRQGYGVNDAVGMIILNS